uniref:SRCR domain-containing protein n=1 Tax=Knipowitschia caucasica TaxID=637954 RepID=A0AAV2JS55_KNICA
MSSQLVLTPPHNPLPKEPLRLVGGASRCDGTVELRHRGKWGRVGKRGGVWTEEDSAAVCRDLDCGSAVSGDERDGFPDSPSWDISPVCMKRRKTKVRDCVYDDTVSSWLGAEVMCSDLLNRPVLSLSVTVGASQVQDSQVQVSQVQVSQVQVSQVQVSQVQVSQVGVQVVRVQLGSQFSVQCSVKPQFPGGSFQLLSPSGNHTLPAVNHSAHFLFNHTGPAHKGDYTCVYHLQVFNHSFTSESERLELRLGVQWFNLIIRVLIILLITLLFILPLCYCYYKREGNDPGERAQREGSDPGERAQMEGSDPERAQREGSDPERAQREGSDPERAQREGSDDPERAQREGSDPERAQREGSDPERAQREGSDPERAQREGSDPERAQREGSDPERAQREGSDPERAQREGSDPERAQREGSDPERAQREGSDPERAQREGSDPERA